MAQRRISAGILLYRRSNDGELEVLLGHPGGPYFTRKDAGYWSIPKGEVDDGEDDLREVALREFAEETGHPLDVSHDALIPLGEIVQKGGKTVVAWAVEGDLDPAAAHSNTFALEWPPRSGQTIDVPEIDRVAWCTPEGARYLVKPTQIPLIDRLEAHLARD
ncbi:MAG TPA: NUDIX domain-containing protein [Candidatus Limnocylindrales bacterium]